MTYAECRLEAMIQTCDWLTFKKDSQSVNMLMKVWVNNTVKHAFQSNSFLKGCCTQIGRNRAGIYTEDVNNCFCIVERTAHQEFPLVSVSTQ